MGHVSYPSAATVSSRFRPAHNLEAEALNESMSAIDEWVSKACFSLKTEC